MTVYELLESHGIDKARLKSAMDSNDNWGGMVHAFEYVTVCSAVLATWPGESHVLHLQTPVPGWDTKISCACGDRFASKAEFWKHQADAYVSMVQS